MCNPWCTASPRHVAATKVFRGSWVTTTQVVVLTAIILFACACSRGASSSPPTTHKSPSVLVARLVAVGSATTAQLHQTAAVILQRLQVAGL
jgi:hypothetical protein